MDANQERELVGQLEKLEGATERIRAEAYRKGWDDKTDSDLSWCPYFLRDFAGDPNGRCGFDCSTDEHKCVDEEPTDGWEIAKLLRKTLSKALRDSERDRANETD